MTGDADLSTDNGRLYARIKGAVGKSEVERKSARQRAACKQRAESGRAWLARRAFGYTKPNRDGTGMRVIESEASLLRDAYAAVLAGRSLRGIAADWNANGVRTTEGNPWVGVVLRKALVNPRYAGLRSYRGEIVGAADWPAIVDRDIFDAVRTKLADPARINRPRDGGPMGARQRLLSGMALCGRPECGKPMSSSVNRRKQPIYACRHCKGTVRNIAQVDAWVIGHIVDRLSREDAADLLLNRNRVDLAELRAKAEALRERRRQIKAMLADPDMPLAEIKAAIADITAKLAEIEPKINDANDTRVFKGLIPDEGERERFYALSEDERRAWVRSRFDGLTLDRQRAAIDRLVTVTIHPGQPATGGFRPDLVVVEPKR